MTVAHRGRLRHSATCPGLDRHKHSLRLLLSCHQLPSYDSVEGPSQLDNYNEQLAPCKLRFSSELLPKINKHLGDVAHMLAPSHPPSSARVGPSRDDTDRIKERLLMLCERSTLASQARRRIRNMDQIFYMSKYLVRPLNEILSCMLLPTGLQLSWQLNTDPERTTCVELVYTPVNHNSEVLAFMEITSVNILPDASLRVFVDSLRCEIVKINYVGQLTIATPLPPNSRSNSCRVMGKVVKNMLQLNVPVAVVTNCRRFIIISNSGPEVKGQDCIGFSDLVSGNDLPGEKLTDSPLGLLLGLTVFALNKRGLSLRTNFGLLTYATTASVLRGFLSERDDYVDRRKSQEIRMKRRAMLEFGRYPSQLGSVSFSFRMPSGFGGNISPLTRSSVSSFVNPFCGPCKMEQTPLAAEVPNLLPDSSAGDAWSIPELQVVNFRGKGDLWDVFSARFAWLPTAPADLLVKFCNLSSFLSTQEEQYLYSRSRARKALRTEVLCYSGPLTPLQGDIVPAFYGVFGAWQPGNNQSWCAMFEDAGESLSPGSGIVPETRRDIRRMYQTLHNHGVLHGDVAWRHILSGPNGLKLISFDRAFIRKDNVSDAQWEIGCKAEMLRLDELLGEGTWSPAPPENDELRKSWTCFPPSIESPSVESLHPPLLFFPGIPIPDISVSPVTAVPSIVIDSEPDFDPYRRRWGFVLPDDDEEREHLEGAPEPKIPRLGLDVPRTVKRQSSAPSVLTHNPKSLFSRASQFFRGVPS